jgi:hypothetical protein
VKGTPRRIQVPEGAFPEAGGQIQDFFSDLLPRAMAAPCVV